MLIVFLTFSTGICWSDYTLRWDRPLFFYAYPNLFKPFSLLIGKNYLSFYREISVNIYSSTKATCYPTILSSFLSESIAFLIALERSFFVKLFPREVWLAVFLSIMVLKARVFIFVGSRSLTLIWWKGFAVTLTTFSECGSMIWKSNISKII